MNAKPRVLMVTYGLPFPPTHGGAIRQWQLARILASFTQLYVVALPVNSDPPLNSPRAQPYAAELAELASGLFVGRHPGESTWQSLGRYARALARLDSPAALQVLTPAQMEWVASVASRVRPDVVLLEFSYLSRLVVQLRRILPNARFIVDCHNVESGIYRDLLGFRHTPGWMTRNLVAYIGTRRLERRWLREADQVWSVSSNDAGRLTKLAALPKPPVVIPNMVPPSVCNPLGTRPETRACAAPARTINAAPAGRMPHEAGERPICFIGRMDYPPNEDAALRLIHVHPKVLRAVPNAVLYLVGRAPTARLVARSKRVPGVRVTGEVESTLPWLAQAEVVAIPLRFGGGTRIKVLEAMALKRTIVATPKAVEGLDVAHGEDMIIAPVQHFAEWLIRLLRDEPLRRRLATNAAGRVTRYMEEWVRHDVERAVEEALDG